MDRMQFRLALNVRAKYDTSHDGVEFHVCDRKSCSVIHLVGVARNGSSLAYTSWILCNAMGRECSIVTRVSLLDVQSAPAPPVGL